jgi:hypothetical protein
MRSSEPMPLRIWSTLAPTRSQMLAISFMNEMRVASIALAAYLVSSADSMSMWMIGLPVRTNGPYSSSMTSAARWDSEPMTTRSGLRKSSMAAPSFRNSGFETTSNSWLVDSLRAPSTLRAVPTGTVDLSTTTV